MLTLVRAKAIYDSDTESMSGTGLVLEGEKILGRGDFQCLSEKYPAAQILDYSGKYVLPGLINTHVHFEFPPVPQTAAAYREEAPHVNFAGALLEAGRLLGSGVTTARDAGSSYRLLDFSAPRIRSGFPLPRIQMAGVPLTPSGGHLHFLGEPADTPEQMAESVRLHREKGCTCIKIIASGGQMTPGSLPEQDTYSAEEMRIIVEEAHRSGLPTLAHCLTEGSYRSAMEAGVDSIEHCAFFVRNHQNGLLERVCRPDTVRRFRGSGRFFMNAFSNNYHRLDAFRSGEKKPDDASAFLLLQEEKEFQIFRSLTEAGMVPTVGTDAGCGCTYFDETWLEIQLMAERGGLTNREAIRAATVSGAEALGWQKKIGRLKPGYLADLIILQKNPLEDIMALRRVDHVILGGRVIK